MFTIGVDVGGTYTDLVATDESGRTVFAKSPSTPGGSVARRDGGAGRTGAAAERDARGNARRDRSAGARHHGCDQRAAGAQGRKGRAAHHRRPSRRHRDARGPQARSLRSALAAAGAAGAARTALWRQGAAQGERRGADSARCEIARRRHCRHQAIRRDLGRGVLPAFLSQSRSRTRRRRAADAGAARHQHLALQRRAAADQGI